MNVKRVFQTCRPTLPQGRKQKGILIVLDTKKKKRCERALRFLQFSDDNGFNDKSQKYEYLLYYYCKIRLSHSIITLVPRTIRATQIVAFIHSSTNSLIFSHGDVNFPFYKSQAWRAYDVWTLLEMLRVAIFCWMVQNFQSHIPERDIWDLFSGDWK